MSDEAGRFLAGQGAIIENKNTGKILIGFRTPNKDYAPGIWDYPSGRKHQFESVEEGLKREVHEEVGLDVEIIKPIRVSNFFRGEEKVENELVYIAYWCKTDSDKVTLSDEYTKYKWVTPEGAMEIIDNDSINTDIKAYIKEKTSKTGK